MRERPNIPIVCGRNKKRSRTAEFIFKNDNRINIRSAGLSPKSNKKLSENDLCWSDLVLVMEKEQKVKIRDLYNHQKLPPIEVLFIPDVYEFMDKELIRLLKDGVNDFLRLFYKI